MKKILMLLLMTISVLAVSSCVSNIDEVNHNSIEFLIAHDKEGGFGIKETDDGFTINVLEIVNSVGELKDLCTIYDNDLFDEYNENYNKKFFSEKALIIYSFWTGHREVTHINNIKTDGTELIMSVLTTRKKGMFKDIAFSWLILIELNKIDISNITTVKTIEM